MEADAAAAAATRAELEEGTFSEAAASGAELKPADASTPRKQPPKDADKPAAPARPAPATAPVTVSKNQKGTGCCVLGPPEDIVEPTSTQPAVGKNGSAPDAQNGAQNGSGVNSSTSGVNSSTSTGDGWGFTSLSWAPLLLPRAPRKADLLLGLTLRGAYSEPSVCEAVAHEVCAEDAAAAASFLNALTGTKSAKLGSSTSGVVDIWLSQLVPRLLHLDPWPILPRELVGRTLSFLPDHPFTRTMFAFLECHCASNVAQAAIDAAKTQAALEDMKSPALKSKEKEAADGVKPSAALTPATASLALPAERMNEVYACLAHLLSSSMRSRSAYLAFLPLWKLTSGSVAPAEALMGTATYLERTVFSQTASSLQSNCLTTPSDELPAPSKLPPGWLPELDADDLSTPGSRRLSTEEWGATPGGATPGATPMKVDVEGNERIVLALASLFVEQPDRLTGFQCLVPSIFETYLVKGSPLRARLCKQLVEGGMDAATVQRISEDDRLVAQRFFWSAPGLKLFGDHPDLQDEGKLTALLTDAVRQQPAILSAFMLSVAARATTSAANGATKGPGSVSIKTVCKVGVIALCTNVRELGIVKHSINPPVPINEAVAVLLEIALTSGEAYDGVLCGCDADDDATTALLDAFAAHYFRVKLGVAARSRMSLEKENRAGSSAADDSFRKLKHSASARLDEALRSPQLGATDQLPRSNSPQSPSRRRRSLSAELTLWELDGPLMSTWPRGNTDGPEQSLLQSRRPSNGLAVPTDALPTSEASDETRRTELASVVRAELDKPTPSVAPSTAAKSPRQASSLPSSPQLYSTPIEFDLPKAPLTPAAGSAPEQTSETPDKTAELTDSPDKTGSTELPEETKRNERVVMCLATLFVARPAKLTAFAQLVPQVFDTYLALGSAPRAELNKLLMEKAFDENLEKLFSETDELVKAPFFWHVDTLRLCTKQCIQKEYSQLNSATLQTQDGVKLHLYSRLLALLLKLAAAGSADAVEITRRTKEVLDQFERNPDQQHFLLSIFLTLQARVDTCIEDFADFPLPVLSEVAANGVHTIASVRAPGMELCETAMTTLLEGYVTNKKPADDL